MVGPAGASEGPVPVESTEGPTGPGSGLITREDPSVEPRGVPPRPDTEEATAIRDPSDRQEEATAVRLSPLQRTLRPPPSRSPRDPLEFPSRSPRDRFSKERMLEASAGLNCTSEIEASDRIWLIRLRRTFPKDSIHHGNCVLFRFRRERIGHRKRHGALEDTKPYLPSPLHADTCPDFISSAVE